MNVKPTSYFDDDEVVKRRDDALRRALNTPPKPQGKAAKTGKKMRQCDLRLVIVRNPDGVRREPNPVGHWVGFEPDDTVSRIVDFQSTGLSHSPTNVSSARA